MNAVFKWGFEFMSGSDAVKPRGDAVLNTMFIVRIKHGFNKSRGQKKILFLFLGSGMKNRFRNT